jgi:hypothetical protein
MGQCEDVCSVLLESQANCILMQQSGNGDKLMVPFSDIPNHRREVSTSDQDFLL